MMVLGFIFAAVSTKLVGITLAFADIELPQVFARPAYLASGLAMAIVGALLVAVPRPQARPGA